MRLRGGRVRMRRRGGRFGGRQAEHVAAFGRSIDVDAELALDDLDGSIAHVRGLGRAGLLSDAEVATLVAGLDGPAPRTSRTASSQWDPALEDVHLNLEAALDRADRAGRRQAPHRALAERPGRDRPPALDAPGDRPARRRAARLRGRARRSRRARGRRGPARHDPHPAGPAGPLRPPPARLRRDGRARPRPARRRAPPR